MGESVATVDLPFRLGCPVWNCEHWLGDVYPRRTPKTGWLHWYTRMFNTVEGNSTFYGLPSLEVAKRWADEAAEGFRFSLKFPQLISHQSRLVDCEKELDRFIEFVQILDDADRLGPSFLQLPPAFSPTATGDLEAFLDLLPDHLPWAVEVRHTDWFDQADHERTLNHMLRERKIDRVLFDSRPLYQSAADDEIEAVSQTRKPKTPVRQTATAGRPMLRLVGRNHIELVDHFIDQWLPILVNWMEQGRQPSVFTHAPDDRFAPALARRFWRKYCEFAGDTLPENLGVDSIPKPPEPPSQLKFF